MVVVREHGMEDDPIERSSIRQGRPQARSRLLSPKAGETTCTWIWECTSGEFRWCPEQRETIVVLQGAVWILVDGQEPEELVAGTHAYYAAGTVSTWRVPDFVRMRITISAPATSDKGVPQCPPTRSGVGKPGA